MTYGEAIEKKLQETETLYDHAGALRDRAHGNEKEHWNNLRRLYRAACDELYKLRDKSETNGLYDQKLNGTY
jgi:hypothetical protein